LLFLLFLQHGFCSRAFLGFEAKEQRKRAWGTLTKTEFEFENYNLNAEKEIQKKKGFKGSAMDTHSIAYVDSQTYTILIYKFLF